MAESRAWVQTVEAEVQMESQTQARFQMNRRWLRWPLYIRMCYMTSDRPAS